MTLAPLYARLNDDGTYTPVIPIAEEDGDLIYIEADDILPSLERERERDNILGIQRSHIPAQIISVPPSSEGDRFVSIAKAIDGIAIFSVRPENLDQAVILRCIQLKWKMRSLWLANHICGKLIPDLPKRYICKLIPNLAFEQLQLEVPYDLALYRLIQAGANDIQHWCRDQGLDYPFPNPFELFLEVLREEFLHIQEHCFELTEHHLHTPHAPEPTKRELQDDHRIWTKFLAQTMDADTEPQKYHECLDVLWQSGWHGRVILALWTQEHYTTDLRKQRAAVARAYRKMMPLIDGQVIWKDGYPALRSSTTHRTFLQAQVKASGHFSFER